MHWIVEQDDRYYNNILYQAMHNYGNKPEKGSLSLLVLHLTWTCLTFYWRKTTFPNKQRVCLSDMLRTLDEEMFNAALEFSSEEMLS